MHSFDRHIKVVIFFIGNYDFGKHGNVFHVCNTFFLAMINTHTPSRKSHTISTTAKELSSVVCVIPYQSCEKEMK